MLPTAQNCTGCSACQNICPQNCIEMKMDMEGFFQPFIRDNFCIHCNKCEIVCPVLTFNTQKRYKEPRVISCQDKTIANLAISTSGGFFGVLGTYVIKQLQGTVYGAAYQAGKAKVAFECARTLEELNRLRGTKYVQAEIGDIYKSVENDLKEKRYVLFSGTPCQVSGLYNYLNKNIRGGGDCHNKLITIDIICHGVPSSGLFEKYICSLEKRYGEKVKNFIFRPKSQEWGKRSSFQKSKIILISGIEVFIEKEDLFFFEGFNRNFYLRRSCYNCAFSQLPRVADFTIGDFWGYEELPSFSFDIKKGLSCVIINSDRAESFFEKIRDSLFWRSENLEIVKKNNGRVCSGSMPDTKRDKFFDCYVKKGFEQSKRYVIKCWRREDRIFRIKLKLKGIIGNKKYLALKRRLKK